MPLQKQAVPINFAQGLDTKVDPKQIQLGKFLALQNTVFDKQGALLKRNGFANITALPDAEQTTLTTLSDNLIATGSNLYAFSQDTDQWLNQGIVQPVQLNTQALIRSSTSQTAPDTALAPSGLLCLVYMDSGNSYYQISDSVTGQQIISRQALPATATNPRVVLLDRYFIITFMATVGASPHLRYIAVPISVPTAPLAAADISATVFSLTTGYDVAVDNDTLYAGWRATAANIQLTSMSRVLIVSSPVTIVGRIADLVSLSVDMAQVWIAFWDDTSDDGYVAAYTSASGFLVQILAPTQIINNIQLNQITSSASGNALTVFYETQNTYAYAPNAKTDYVSKLVIDTSANITGPDIILRSVGLASKAFLDEASSLIYMLVTYGEINQPTYFLIDENGNIYMRLAYSNGGGYQTTQVLPSVNFLDDTYYVPYTIKDFLTTINKTTNAPSGTPTSAIYTQTGINLAKFSINTRVQYSSEIAGALHLTGGQLWQYDGVRPVEHGFHVWPENNTVTTAGVGGLITAGTYYYVFTYEWTDNQGNLHRSAPSIPVSIVTTGSTSANTLNVPTLRLTYKVQPNPVRIVGYRWSVAQQTYYQFTSVTSPVFNDPTVDSVTVVDTLADSAILGQTLLYTTGGVVENIAAPASIDSALFKNRLFLIDAEDRNLLWYSKQVIQTTPVEMSDLLTLYVAPTSGAQGSTGPMTALGAMDDKLLMFKRDAIYYLTGLGPDNTGANNDFTDPIFITSAVGCDNPSSVVLMPQGVMFQSDKGIWLLGRDLSTSYIGAPVELYNSQTVVSAQAIPGTNQVRFVLDNNITLMYDYYFGQWGTFNNTFAISSTLYQGKQTYLNSYGQVFQETANTWLDGSEPVLLSLVTGWVNLAGVQGYERFYEMLLLGNYYSPFKLNVQFAYDYNDSPSHNVMVEPDNYSKPWGGEAQWGSGGPWGGPGRIFEARVFPEQQKCESFQIMINEIYDPSFPNSTGIVPAGQGLSLSGLNLLIGMKKGSRTQKASQSFG